MLAKSIWDEMNEARRSFDQLFHSLTTEDRARQQRDVHFSPGVETGWTDEAFNLRFIIPGVEEKSLTTTVQGNQLLVQGERHMPENFAKEGRGQFHLAYGRFERLVELPAGVNVEKLRARLNNGILHVSVPLSERMKPRLVRVEAPLVDSWRLETASV